MFMANRRKHLWTLKVNCFSIKLRASSGVNFEMIPLINTKYKNTPEEIQEFI